MVIIEKTKHYNTQDLMDCVDNSLLKEPAKNLLKKFIDDISIQTAEFYHQFSRQSMSIDGYRLLYNLNKSFAQLIFNCLSSESISMDYIDREVRSMNNQVFSMVKSVESQLSVKTYNRLLAIRDKINDISDKFIAKCPGIVVNNQNIYGFTSENIEDFMNPKYYKLKVGEEDTLDDTDSKEDKDKHKIKHIDLDKLGLRVKRF